MNLVTLIGRLGQDPDIRTMQNSEKTAALSVATSEKWTDSNGVERNITEIIAEQVQMLSSGEKNAANTAENKPQPKQKNQDVMTADEQKDIPPQFDDDIPF